MAIVLDQKPDETLLQYYRRLAKAADTRLDRLEDYETQLYYKPATKWAYASAAKDIKKWNQLTSAKVRKLRFNTKPPEGEEQLIAKISDIRKFLASPTSTKQGITEVYKKRAATTNATYGTNFTWQQLAKFYQSGQAQAWDAKFASKTALRTIAQLQKNKKKLTGDIEKADVKDLRIDDEALEMTVSMALKDNNLKIKDLL